MVAAGGPDRGGAGGVMFEPRSLDHDGWVQAVRRAAASVSAQAVGEAFLVSLASRRMDLRSALASYAVARLLPEHREAVRRGLGCAVCGVRVHRDADGAIEPVDLNDLSQSRFWGGDWLNVTYAAFDLEQFVRAPRPDLTSAHVALGQQVIDFLRQLPPKTTAAQAAPLLTMVPGTGSEREVTMDILGVCGILHSPGYPGYFDEFIPAWRAETMWPTQRFVFGHYPTCWWKADGGINEKALHLFLPCLA